MKTYALPALLEILREPCGIEACGHCEIELQAAEEINRLQAQVAALQRDLEDERKDGDEERGEVERLQEQVRYEQERCKLNAACHAMQVGELQAKIASLEAELDASNNRFHAMNTPTGREIELQHELISERQRSRRLAEAASHFWRKRDRLRRAYLELWRRANGAAWRHDNE